LPRTAISVPLPGGFRLADAAFTLLEVLCAIVVILILVTLMVPGYESIRGRIEKVACSNNLRQVYVGANSYVQEYGHWPQIDPALLKKSDNAYDEAWIEALLPFGIGRGSWICPTIQRDLGGPDYNQPANYRTDYMAMPFDSKHVTPYQWPTSPWFVERGNVHGDGNLMIQTNGAVSELTQMQLSAPATAPAPPGP